MNKKNEMRLYEVEILNKDDDGKATGIAHSWKGLATSEENARYLSGVANSITNLDDYIVLTRPFV